MQGYYKFVTRFPVALLLSKKDKPENIAETIRQLYSDFYSVSFKETGRATEDEKEFVFWPLLDPDCNVYESEGLEMAEKIKESQSSIEEDYCIDED